MGYFTEIFRISQEDIALLGMKSIYVLLVLGLAWIGWLISRRLLLHWISRIAYKTKTHWDNYLLEQKFFTRLCYLVPATIIYLSAPIVFETRGIAFNMMRVFAELYMVVTGILVVMAFLDAVHRILSDYEFSKRIPIKGFLQVIKIITVLAGSIVIISITIGKPPYAFLGGLGAMTAVIMLVFKDSILGLVAGIQLSANEMVSLGDWIEMPDFGADGNVIDIALTTIKVQNWDKTITTIPTYALISSSFKNWRGMSRSGGRRIMRAINLDMNTIAFLSETDRKSLLEIDILRPYIERKQAELAEYNKSRGVSDNTLPAYGRRMTNIGTFRAYVVEYLKAHPLINQEMTFLVRQLPPSSEGLPIQIYVFSKEKEWAIYEEVQADIFDHLLSVVPLFGLRLFQAPTGRDISQRLQDH